MKNIIITIIKITTMTRKGVIEKKHSCSFFCKSGLYSFTSFKYKTSTLT